MAGPLIRPDVLVIDLLNAGWDSCGCELEVAQPQLELTSAGRTGLPATKAGLGFEFLRSCETPATQNNIFASHRIMLIQLLSSMVSFNLSSDDLNKVPNR